jgi:hypothetical protein
MMALLSLITTMSSIPTFYRCIDTGTTPPPPRFLAGVARTVIVEEQHAYRKSLSSSRGSRLHIQSRIVIVLFGSFTEVDQSSDQSSSQSIVIRSVFSSFDQSFRKPISLAVRHRSGFTEADHSRRPLSHSHCHCCQLSLCLFR